MKRLLQAIAQDMNQALAGELRGLYLYGSLTTSYFQAGESDINLLAVVQDSSDPHTIRQAARPVWEAYREQIKQPPLLVKLTALRRHVNLFPNFGYHLAQNGRVLHGEANLLGNLPGRSTVEFLSHLASDALAASTALTPHLLTPEAASLAEKKLRGLARRLLQRPLKPDETAVDLFATILDFLSRKITALGTTQFPSPTTPDDSPLPGLYAIYKRDIGCTVLVFDQLTAARIKSTDWHHVARQVDDHCTCLHVTTVSQLLLLTSLETPLDMVFRRYTLKWGEDPLANLNLSRDYSLRHAARLPSNIAITELPAAYLSAPDDKANTIVHDFQNKLLNIQLENEILYRMGYLERFIPAIPLPGREAPTPERIRAIFDHLDQWSEFYYNKMKQAADQKGNN